MIRYILIVIIILCGLTVTAQNTYFNTQFVQEKKVLEKEAYKELRKSNVYDKQDSLRIIFIYAFEEINIVEYELSNNQYLAKIKPYYKYSNYFLFELFKTKFPTKKRLYANGYVINRNNKLIATITSTNGYSFRFKPFIYNAYYETYNNEYNNLTKNVLSQNYDLLFYLGLMGFDKIWCVKGNETWVYDIEQQKFLTLGEYYNCCWKYHTVEDILGMPK